MRLLEPLDERGGERVGVEGGKPVGDGGRESQGGREPLQDGGAAARVGEDLFEEVLDVEHLGEEAEDLLEPPVLLAGPRPVQDVVEQEILHHPRCHPVDLAARLVDDDGPEPSDFGVDGDRHGGTPEAAAGE